MSKVFGAAFYVKDGKMSNDAEIITFDCDKDYLLKDIDKNIISTPILIREKTAVVFLAYSEDNIRSFLKGFNTQREYIEHIYNDKDEQEMMHV
jgi:hypothetical protein